MTDLKKEIIENQFQQTPTQLQPPNQRWLMKTSFNKHQHNYRNLINNG